MVMHDSPSVLHSLEDQREQAVWLLAIRHGELKLAGDHGGASAKQIDIQVLELQLAHLLAFRLVALAVAE